MPHTIAGALSEVALLAHAQDMQWTELGRLTGCPASRQRDASGREVYASIYFVDVDSPSDVGLRAFRPDDDLEVLSTLGRYGETMLEADHLLLPHGLVPDPEPATLPPGLRVRLSNVLVALGGGPDDLRISSPANARLDAVPLLPTQPESYRLVREAQVRGAFFDPPPGARALCATPYVAVLPINPDRDLNGVGLLYFANYVAFLDAAERMALQGEAGFPPAALDGRATVRRRIGFYGNARSSDVLVVEVEAFALDAVRLLVQHRVRRRSDDRLIAIASAERRLVAP
jgi:probable biosynthetic protein (TIGR04098 family)